MRVRKVLPKETVRYDVPKTKLRLVKVIGGLEENDHGFSWG